MPIFDFKCRKCNNIYELLVRSIATDIPVCPICLASGETQSKQVSSAKVFIGLPMGNGKFNKMNTNKPPQ